MKVKANRAYGFALRPAVQPEWFYSSLARELGIEELMAAAVSGRPARTTRSPAGSTAWPLSPRAPGWTWGSPRQLGEAISDTRLGPAAFQISVFAKPLPPSFVGRWYVHGSQFVISSTTRGSEVSNAGQCGPGDILDPNRPWCEERVDYRFRLSAHGRSLHATVTSARVVESRTGRPHPEIETSSKAGEQFTLRFAGPNQLVRSPWPQGNPYLCNQRTPDRLQHRCGA